MSRERGLDDIGPESWYDSMPFVTKHWLAAVVIITVSCNLGVLPIDKLVYVFDSIKSDFEIWRLFTPFLYMGGFTKQEGFSTVISTFLLYQYSKQYESGIGFNTGGAGGTSDYIFMLLFGMVMNLVTNIYFQRYVLCKMLVYYVLYVWSKRYPTAQANIWGVPVPANLLPFALLLLHFCLGNDYMEYVQGYTVGHLYYFMADVVPKVYGQSYLQTPAFLLTKFGIGEYVPPAPVNGMGATGSNVRSGFGGPGRVNAPNNPAASSSGHSWGSGGQRLGR